MSPLAKEDRGKPRTVGLESTENLQASMNYKRKHEMRTVCTHIALNVSDEQNWLAYIPWYWPTWRTENINFLEVNNCARRTHFDPYE